VIVDLGTGDGRAVLDRALGEPRALVIGIDASAAAMVDASRRAARRGPRNALFFAAGAEALPSSPLVGCADVVTVTFPWGSLLRGIVGLDPTALAGVAAPLRVGGHLVVLASIVPSDGVPGLDRLDGSAAPTICAAWRQAGLELTSLRAATPSEIAASVSSWARRLRSGGSPRPVWVLEGRKMSMVTDSDGVETAVR
jgi:16S rRNA (adenine(1408)-N(1))-methyltransferase